MINCPECGSPMASIGNVNGNYKTMSPMLFTETHVCVECRVKVVESKRGYVPFEVCRNLPFDLADFREVKLS